MCQVTIVSCVNASAMCQFVVVLFNYSDHTQFGSKISKWYPLLSFSQFSTQIRNVHQCSTLPRVSLWFFLFLF